MMSPEDVGQAQRRTTSGGGLPVPLNLIHRNKPSNALGMRVTARFESEKGLPFELLKAPCLVSYMLGWRAGYAAKSKP